MTQEFQALFAEELETLRLKHLFRKLRTLREVRGTHARWEDRDLILFCGNDYLGLSQDPRVIRAASEALQREGVGAGAARLISGTRALHVQLETELAEFKGKEQALLFGSGYLANVGTLSALAKENDWILLDKLCHASLIDGARLSGARVRTFPHKNYSRCEEILKQSDGEGKRILVSETLFSMDGDQADLARLVTLKEKYHCLLLLDDAHATGVFGPEGKGLAYEIKEAGETFGEKIDLIVGTLSKAFGVFGGFVAGSRRLIEYLINASRPFLFATALPPHLCQAALAALHFIREEESLRNRLWRNVERVLEFLKQRGIPTPERSPILPLFVGEEGEALRVSDALLERGILIPAIRYPTVPRGRARLRLTVSAGHTEEDLERLFQALSEVWR